MKQIDCRSSVMYFLWGGSESFSYNTVQHPVKVFLGGMWLKQNSDSGSDRLEEKCVM